METSAFANQPASGTPGSTTGAYTGTQTEDAYTGPVQQRRATQLTTVAIIAAAFFLIGYVVGRKEEERSRKSISDHVLDQLQDWVGQSGRTLNDLRGPLEKGLRSSGEALGDVLTKAANSKAASKIAEVTGRKEEKFLGIF